MKNCPCKSTEQGIARDPEKNLKFERILSAWKIFTWNVFIFTYLTNDFVELVNICTNTS